PAEFRLDVKSPAISRPTLVTGAKRRRSTGRPASWIRGQSGVSIYESFRIGKSIRQETESAEGVHAAFIALKFSGPPSAQGGGNDRHGTGERVLENGHISCHQATKDC